jgi:hypothetical protein
MQDEIKRFQCRHIFTDGRRCGSACLRQEEFCYYHHTTRRPVADPRQRHSRRSTFDLPHPEDRSAIQSSIGEVLRRIAANEIDTKRAGLLLYGLQIASINLPRATPPSRDTKPRLYSYGEPNDEDSSETSLVKEFIVDPRLGALAPRTEIVEEERKLTVIGQLLKDLHERRAATAKAESDALATPPPALEHAVETPQNPRHADAILPTIQAREETREDTRKDKEVAAEITPTGLQPLAERTTTRKSARKLTRTARIAIVRGFREYPGRAIRETRCAEGWRKAQAN